MKIILILLLILLSNYANCSIEKVDQFILKIDSAMMETSPPNRPKILEYDIPNENQKKYRKNYHTYIKKRNKKLSQEQINNILHVININADRYNIPNSLLLSLIQIESNFNPKAKSNKGAYGLTQVHYRTWNKTYNIKNHKQLYNIDTNIMIGSSILNRYLVSCDMSHDCALNKYLGKPDKIYKNKIKGIMKKINNTKVVKK